MLGIAVWWWLANDPESAYYLTLEEKQLVVVRKERQSGYSKTADQFSKADVIKGLKDWKIWMFCLGQFGVDTMLYGYSTFLPTIIRGLGDWTTAEVQCLTIPCYGLGAITYLIVAWTSDRLQMRGVFTVAFGLISVVGYIILLCPVANGVKYFGCFVVALGLYVVVGIPLGWLPASEYRRLLSYFQHANLGTDNPRYGKRTTATGLQVSVTTSISSAFSDSLQLAYVRQPKRYICTVRLYNWKWSTLHSRSRCESGNGGNGSCCLRHHVGLLPECE